MSDFDRKSIFISNIDMIKIVKPFFFWKLESKNFLLASGIHFLYSKADPVLESVRKEPVLTLSSLV